MAFNSTLTVGTATFERLDTGYWILSTSTPDQPTYLSIKSRVKNGSEASDYLVRIEQRKNSATPGAEDDVLTVHTVIKSSLKAYTQSEIEARLAELFSFLSSTSNVTKLLRGER